MKALQERVNGFIAELDALRRKLYAFELVWDLLWENELLGDNPNYVKVRDEERSGPFTDPRDAALHLQTYMVTWRWDPEAERWHVTDSELDGLASEGATASEAVRNAYEAAELLLESGELVLWSVFEKRGQS